MTRKLLGLLIFTLIISVYTQTRADAFTWFGWRKDNTEIIYQKSDEHHIRHHRPHPPKPNCHDPKHKHKPECKKKGPKPHRGWRKHK